MPIKLKQLNLQLLRQNTKNSHSNKNSISVIIAFFPVYSAFTKPFVHNGRARKKNHFTLRHSVFYRSARWCCKECSVDIAHIPPEDPRDIQSDCLQTFQ